VGKRQRDSNLSEAAVILSEAKDLLSGPFATESTELTERHGATMPLFVRRADALRGIPLDSLSIRGNA
jgi:hypothetical protein